jgi:hypothetical protein
LEVLFAGGRGYVYMGRPHMAVKADGHAADHQEVDSLLGELGKDALYIELSQGADGGRRPLLRP